MDSRDDRGIALRVRAGGGPPPHPRSVRQPDVAASEPGAGRKNARRLRRLSRGCSIPPPASFSCQPPESPNTVRAPPASSSPTQPRSPMRSRKPPRTGRSATCRCCSTPPSTRAPPRRRKCLPLTSGRGLCELAAKGSRCVSLPMSSRPAGRDCDNVAMQLLSQPSPFPLSSG